MSPFIFIVVGLAVWRLSYAIVNEKGPLDVFARLRASLARSQRRSGGLFDLISCVYCVSVWIGLLAALGLSESFTQWLAYGLAFSAVAILAERLTSAKI